ncbi:G2/M phase-specific E3 ubiquitin-protein ligase isoform X2 [Astyanax mexicanus]|uniref:G2/M phase-specific E3 ubiquitin-protein ligase-like isoform X2 n=1 Tax=Astyanax mexicanus TaxID=7994 RepID=UPI000BBDAEB3|nr:G2/M phase-specific E3 ubiquitin-protein ligase-like isoform X2 [Astyanax mexicanus]XP_049319416.1 G2/M phase-specific E3 ubiquitin-protein ligase isoform X2 [Astyanax mexicanus]
MVLAICLREHLCFCQKVDYNSTVAAAAQSLINVLTQNLSHGQQEQGRRQEQSQSTVEQDMARSFPGFFTKKSYLGKRKIQSLKTYGPANTKTWKSFSFYSYLLNRNSELTPTSSEEFEFAQAGLGKRHLTMLKDMNHDEIFELLQIEYPKMKGLTGGWLLYKATGGQGRRRLIMIPPDSNGYTGSLIRSVTGAGKSILYIVPLQHEFDLTPLPPDAIEFQRMPKAQCQTCKVSFPLQILALHVQECTESPSSAEDAETCSSEVQIVSVTAPPVFCDPETAVEEVPCPICFIEFTPQFLEVHASSCGEREKDDLMMAERSDVSQDNEGEQIKSVDDILDTISRRVDHEKQFHIQISRTNILERGLLQWQRQKKNLPTAALKVTFFGEAGVDTGALRKEFLTEMVAGIEDRFFEGTQNKKSPRYSLTDFDNGMYRTVGEILAVSLAQGGPAPTFFSPWSYYYLCNGQINPTTLNSDAVADVHLRGLIDQVEKSTEHSIEDLSDEILNCGYTGTISIQNKELIIRAVILHAVLRLQPMLEQLREGLQLYDLLSLLRQYPDICQPLLVPGEDVKVSAEFVMASICPQLSDKGSTRHQIELELINFLQDFLYEAEVEDQGHGEEKEGPHSITPARFLQWVTGQGHIPLLPSEKKDFAVTVKFNHDCNADFGIHNICYPVVSACAKRIVLPVRHIKSYDQFKSILLEAFYLGQEFNIV